MSNSKSIVSSKFYKVRQAAQYIGVSPSQIRLLCESGELESTRTVGSHRLISVASILSYCGEEEESTSSNGKIPVGIVGRVSTSRQGIGLAKGEESDLTRQMDLLRDYAANKWGDKAEITEYVRIASGMAYNNETFLRLVSDILAGKFKGGYILCTHPDRILRFSLSLFETVCKHGDCEIICINESDDKGETESLADDVLAVICHFSAKSYGRRSKERCEKNLTDDCVKRIQELRSNNLDGSAIHKQIVKEGWLNSHNETPSYTTIRKYLAKDFELARKIEGKEGETGFELFNQFVLTNCVKGQAYRVNNRDLFAAYGKYCQKQNKALPPASTIGQYISKMGLSRSKSNGVRVTLGITLKS